MMTPTQKARQADEYREDGKYAKVNPCYVCGKSAGVDYFGHPDSDGLIDDELLCLCKDCYNKLSKYDGKTAIAIAFGGAKEPKPKKTTERPEGLDEHWVKDKGVWCPFCGRRKLWRDTNVDPDATHHCTNCGENLLIVGACALREATE